MRRAHHMPFGAEVRENGTTRFRLWAPSKACVEVELEGPGTERKHKVMQRLDDGWHEHVDPEAPAGTRYRYRFEGDVRVPDPASRFNPEDVHGPSQVVDPRAYAWQDDGWTGRPWREAVIYELHVGIFTPAGTFLAAIERLGELQALGITAIELLPVADFPGMRNWGYDGVLPFAPDASYGTPEEMKAFIDAAHGHGLMVLLDVVYNHFGPEGNYLHGYCPEFFDATQHTPWGAAIDFDGAGRGPVRDYFRHNALYWVEEFHLDGLRLDAVHAIVDTSARHIVCEIADALRMGPGTRREVHLVLENDRNDASLLVRDDRGLPNCADAQWNDDLHHAAHVLLTGETDSYYGDYADSSGRRNLAHLARALAEGYSYQGQPSPHRGGALQGQRSAHLPGTAFVSFLQNHDQIGNRAFGERIDALADPTRLEALYACLLLSPHIPMLFCGEEFAASTPFLFFCDFGPELAAAVSDGRRSEFSRFAAFRDEAKRAQIPDPNAPATFARSKLQWAERDLDLHAGRLDLIRRLLALRHEHLVPRLAGPLRGGGHRVQDGVMRVEWSLGDGTPWQLVANFGDSVVTDAVTPVGIDVYSHGVVSNNAAVLLAPNAVRVSRVDRDG